MGGGERLAGVAGAGAGVALDEEVEREEGEGEDAEGGGAGGGCGDAAKAFAPLRETVRGAFWRWIVAG